jgi:hypothetical protein
MLEIPAQEGTMNRTGESAVRRERMAVHLVGEDDVVERLADGDRAPDRPVIHAARDEVGVKAIGHHIYGRTR